jgi:hypothetical protein
MKSKFERIEAIKEEIEKFGLLTLDKTKLAKKHNVSRTTIYSDLKDIVLDIDPDSLVISKFIIQDSFKRALIKINNIIETSTDERYLFQYLELNRRTLDSFNSYLNNLSEIVNINNISNQEDKYKIKINVNHTLSQLEEIPEDKWNDIIEQKKELTKNGRYKL